MPKETPKLQKTHPVPQHIAAFEFKLIGDLTLKQFLFAGMGVAVCYAAWISNLGFLTKWATIIIAGGLGLGTAFFPIQDRTLDSWILSFIAALFSPTQRIWRKEPLAPEYLREDYSQFLTSQVLSLTPLQGRRKLKEYLEAVPQKEFLLGEKEEEQFIEKLNFNFPVPAPTPTPKPPSLPKTPPPLGQRPATKPTKPPELVSRVTPVRPAKPVEGTIRVKPRPLAERKLPAPTVKDLIREVKKPQRDISQLERQNVELKNKLEQAEQQLKSLLTLKEERAKDEAYHTRLREQEKEVRQLTERQKTAQRTISKISGSEEKEEHIIEKQLPNVVSGIVKNKEGKLLEGVVVIIKDRDADPARALKTDRLGRFAIATPLESGEYTVEISGKGKSFDIMRVVIDGAVLTPLEFKEKND